MDIIDNLERVEQFTAGMDRAAFTANEAIQFAVQYALLIISEAARKLGADADRLAPDEPWADIRSIGNVLRHQYDDVNPDVIWRIVQRDVATLKAASQRAVTALATGSLEEPPNQ